MTKNQLDVIGYIDDRLVEKAETYKSTKKKKSRVKWLILAVCIPLMISISVFASETVRYNAAVAYLTSLGIPVEDLSDYSRKDIKKAARIIEAKETLADGESNALVDEYYNSGTSSEEMVDTRAKVTSEQVKELTPTMTRKEVLEFLGNTVDVGSGIYIYEYEVDEKYLLSIPFAGDDAQLGVNGSDLLEALKPFEE